MTINTATPTRVLRRTGGSAICLVVGVLFGLVSVFSNSRASCALWVALALVFTFGAGRLFSLRSRQPYPNEEQQ